MSSDLPIFESNNSVFTAHSLATTATSPILEVKECRTFALQPIASGSSVLGTVQLQGSTDGVNFGNMGSSIDLSSANMVPVNYPDQGIPYLQVVFTTASGSGSLTVNISCKR